MKTTILKVVGTYYYDAKAALINGALKKGAQLKLVADLNNEHDKHAVAVYAGGYKIGHLARDYAKKYQRLILENKIGRATVYSAEFLTGSNRVDLKVSISYEDDHQSHIADEAVDIPNTPGAYQILVDGVVRYIGSTANLNSRYCTHFSDLRRGVHSNNLLQEAYTRLGPKYFRFEIIAQVKAAAQALQLEEHEILRRHAAGEKLYNKTMTGEGYATHSKPSAESIADYGSATGATKTSGSKIYSSSAKKTEKDTLTPRSILFTQCATCGNSHEAYRMFKYKGKWECEPCRTYRAAAHEKAEQSRLDEVKRRREVELARKQQEQQERQREAESPFKGGEQEIDIDLPKEEHKSAKLQGEVRIPKDQKTYFLKGKKNIEHSPSVGLKVSFSVLAFVFIVSLIGSLESYYRSSPAPVGTVRSPQPNQSTQAQQEFVISAAREALILNNASPAIPALGLPANATLIEGGKNWICNEGYHQVRSTCVAEPASIRIGNTNSRDNLDTSWIYLGKSFGGGNKYVDENHIGDYGIQRYVKTRTVHNVTQRGVDRIGDDGNRFYDFTYPYKSRVMEVVIICSMGISATLYARYYSGDLPLSSGLVLIIDESEDLFWSNVSFEFEPEIYDRICKM